MSISRTDRRPRSPSHVLYRRVHGRLTGPSLPGLAVRTGSATRSAAAPTGAEVGPTSTLIERIVDVAGTLGTLLAVLQREASRSALDRLRQGRDEFLRPSGTRK